MWRELWGREVVKCWLQGDQRGEISFPVQTLLPRVSSERHAGKSWLDCKAKLHNDLLTSNSCPISFIHAADPNGETTDAAGWRHGASGKTWNRNKESQMQKKGGGERQISAFAAALCVGSNVFRVPLSSKFYYHVILTAASPLSANPKPKQNTILRTVTLKGSHFSFLSPAGPLTRIQMPQN